MALARRTRSTRLLIITLVFASLLTITVDYRGGQSGPLALAGKSALTIIGPMQRAVATITHPVGAFFSGVAHIASLESQNRRLKEDLQQARNEAAQGGTATTENDQLRKLLGIQHSLGLRGVTASVIAQSLSNFEWSVTISAGSSHGVKMDMPVVGGLGLVGHVTQVALDWSRVTLIIDPESSVAGRLVKTGDTGLVVGNRDQDMVMQMVNPQARVVPGEQVVTAGYQGALYPPGILIGVVSHVAPAEGSLVKNVSIAPLVDFSSLQFVTVVTGARPVPAGASPSPGAAGSPSSAASPSGAAG